jgi:hypothetical protein
MQHSAYLCSIEMIVLEFWIAKPSLWNELIRALEVHLEVGDGEVVYPTLTFSGTY